MDAVAALVPAALYMKRKRERERDPAPLKCYRRGLKGEEEVSTRLWMRRSPVRTLLSPSKQLPKAVGGAAAAAAAVDVDEVSLEMKGRHREEMG